MPRQFFSIVLISSTLSGCSPTITGPAKLVRSADSPYKFALLSGTAAIESATVRVMLIDRNRARRVQALPTSWSSAVLRLHAIDAVATLTQDQVAIIDQTTDFTGNSTNTAVFTTLRPGNYLFQIALFTGPGGTGYSAAVNTTKLVLKGGSDTAITVTMKTTDGTNNSNGGTTLNMQVNDTSGAIRSGKANLNSVLGGPTSMPIIVAGDTVVIAPKLSDSLAAGGAVVTSGNSTASSIADLDPGVLSRVLLTYAPITTEVTTANLADNETILTDWVRTGNEPIRGISWAALADMDDAGTWPSRGSATRTGSGTFAGSFNWNTTIETFSPSLIFSDEASLSANYQLIYRYFDNSYYHSLIRIRNQLLAVIMPASIKLGVQ
ncbi:MAG: hypothetical protein HY692_02495 [Cyanobacteria bacterium NC_groundwater_1444_Ag_S-0.65um_54_12]|nr:hypothetical protein [Cyanobacteria bacterium NC_groundwater_1444_Ag_S-0.65um_54_12]